MGRPEQETQPEIKPSKPKTPKKPYSENVALQRAHKL